MGLRPYTYSTLFGLLAVTGMRTNEPLQLDRENVDLSHGVLTVRGAKFGKSRYVPIHASTRRALRRYALQRDRRCVNPQSLSFFISERGTRVTEWSLRWTFVKLSHEIGLRSPADTHGPRLLDFRHRFAVNTLIRWYRAGIDVERHLPELATYLGHQQITDTYWYLSAVPELMHLAVQRLERTVRGGQS
jgi:integrase